jgi:TolA-binding protein
VLTLEGLPVEPARAPLDHAQANPLTLIRQLEHRVNTLQERAERLRAEHQDAIHEEQRAREALDRPFKYAEQLLDARRQQDRIDQQIGDRHHEHQDAERTAAPAGVDAAPAAHTVHGESPAAGERDLEPETAESLRLLRATQAKPIEEALRSPAAANPPAQNLTRAPSRSSRPRR